MRLLAVILLMALASVAAEAAMTAADSIRALVNLFDLTLAENPYRADSIAELVYQRAICNRDTAIAASMLASRADINANNRDTLNMLLMRAERLSRCPKAEENILFIRMNSNSWYRDNALESERLRRFAEQFRQYTLSPPDDLNERIVLLHSVCVCLPFYLNTSTLYDHLNRLTELIYRKPDNYFKLKVLLCRCEALGYSQLHDIDRSMDAELRLLEYMDSVESGIHARGRHYFQLNFSRFRSYTRLLSNFEHLTPNQIQQYYRLAKLYLGKSSRARREYESAPVADVFYYLSNKDYAHAAPLIDRTLQLTNLTKTRRMTLLRYRIECASALGEDAALHDAGFKYIKLLESSLQQNQSDSDRGRRAVYDAFVARDELSRFEASERADIIETQQLVSVCFIVAMAIMFVFLIIIWHQKIRRQQLAKQLMQANCALQAQLTTKSIAIERLTADMDAARASLEVKDDFIRHLSEELAQPFTSIVEHSCLVVDCCTDHPNRKYLAEYLASIESNGAVISALLDDMRQLNSVEDGSAMPLHRPVDVCYVLSLAVDSVTTDVPVALHLPPNRLQILSDEARLRQVCITILQNLLQLAPEAVEITAQDTDDGRQTVVAFAANRAELANYNPFAARTDSAASPSGTTRLDGMLYTRLIVHLLGGDLISDPTYTAGLRLILTLPHA